MSRAPSTTALVFADVGSLSAVRASILRQVIEQTIDPNFVVGSSVGALNAACYSTTPNIDGIANPAEIWRMFRTAISSPAISARSWILRPSAITARICLNLRRIIEHLPYRNPGRIQPPS